MSEKCKWLHEQLEQFKAVKYSNLDLKALPENGIYFFYEKNEIWGHGGNKPRIVRVGTHRDGNFRSRIAEHYLINETKMEFDKDKPKPSDRSIFRKNIGRALLNKKEDDYLKIWEKDFMSRETREKFSYLRDIEREREIEAQITKLLRINFSFRFTEIGIQIHRIGKTGLESHLIGTLAKCPQCKASSNWLGKSSPKEHISKGKLWLIQHLKADPINEKEKEIILEAIMNMQLRGEPSF